MGKQLRKHSLAAAVGLVVDRLVAEPPSQLHPVAQFGRLAGRFWHDSRLAGAALALGGMGGAAAIGMGLSRVFGPRVATAIASGLCIGGRALDEAALAVHDAMEMGDLDRARLLLPALVGRDPWQLDEKEIARAVVESVAENTVDAVIAPLLWGALAGAAGALGYRAINTLDAMVGHRDERHLRFGWASAKADDVANWLPARVAALAVIACRPAKRKEIVRAVVHDAPAHPSPNAGVAEAAFAGALGLRLGGQNRYGDRVETRPALGAGRTPQSTDIIRAVRLSRQVGAVVAGALVVVTW